MGTFMLFTLAFLCSKEISISSLQVFRWTYLCRSKHLYRPVLDLLFTWFSEWYQLCCDPDLSSKHLYQPEYETVVNFRTIGIFQVIMSWSAQNLGRCSVNRSADLYRSTLCQYKSGRHSYNLCKRIICVAEDIRQILFGWSQTVAAWNLGF